MGIWDRTGLVSIVNGSAVLTGSLTTWNATARVGDGVLINGGSKPYEIKSVDSNTQITLETNFGETTVSGGTFTILPFSYRRVIPSDVLEQVRKILASQTDVFETSGPPDNSLGSDNSIAFDPTARVYYYKTDGAYGAPVSLGGADGVDVGFKAVFDTATGMSDPGSGKIRFNNATRASVTAIAIDDLAADGGAPDVSTFILSWDDSTNPVRGTLILREVGAVQNFAIFSITGASVDNVGWTQLAVAHVLSGGTFSNGAILTAAFIRAGDRGAAGLDGVSAGPVWALSTNTTMADPGAGLLRFNNGTIASATALAIDALSAAAGNPSLASFINSWDDSSNTAHRGTLTFTKLGAMQNYAVFAITSAVTDNTGWHQVTISHVNSAGSFSNNDVLVVQFDRTGNKGVDGSDGVSAGFKMTWKASITMADPSAGGLRFNNATLASVTALAFSEANAEVGNPSIAATLAAWDDSTNTAHRGLITVKKFGAPQNFAQYAINAGNTDNSGWKQIAVAHVNSAGSFADNDIVTVEFERTGNKGTDGAGTGDVIAANNLGDLASPHEGYDNVHLLAADIVATATLNLDTATGSLVNVTGTTGISAVTLTQGKVRRVRFDAALTLTHSANLVLPGGANIVTAQGDYAEFVGRPSGVVHCTKYQKGNGAPTTPVDVSSAAGVTGVLRSASVPVLTGAVACAGGTGATTSTAALTFIIGDGANTITTGLKGFLYIPYACTITQWTLVADASGSIVVDIWSDVYANGRPTVADTITASAKPTISAANTGQSGTLTGWTTAIPAGNFIGINVDSITTCKQVTLVLRVTKT